MIQHVQDTERMTICSRCCMLDSRFDRSTGMIHLRGLESDRPHLDRTDAFPGVDELPRVLASQGCDPPPANRLCSR